MTKTVENVQEKEREEIYTYSELEKIADKITTEIAKELNDYYAKAHIFFNSIEVEVGVPFAEISEAVSERVSEYVKSGEIDEDEAEELYDDWFDEELNWINEEYMINICGRIETEKYVVYFRPSQCGGDYCIAGLEAEIEFKDKVTDIDISNIAQLIITVFRL
jgi:hypothetical protein